VERYWEQLSLYLLKSPKQLTNSSQRVIMSFFGPTFAPPEDAIRYLPWATANESYNDLSCSAETNFEGALYDFISAPGNSMKPIADLDSQAANCMYMLTSLFPVLYTFSTIALFSTKDANYFNDEFSLTTLPNVNTDSDTMHNSVYSVASGRNSIACSTVAEMDRNSTTFSTSESPPSHEESCPTKRINIPPSISPISKGKPTTSPKEKPSISTSATDTICSHGGNHKVQLRTVSGNRKTSTVCKTPYLLSSSNPNYSFPTDQSGGPFTIKPPCRRLSHNIVEKQYRVRLKVKFEQLLSVLPADQLYQDDRNDSKDRRISKADVLCLARRRIMALEQELRELRAERRTVVDNVRIL
jgi:hypothetical protein